MDVMEGRFDGGEASGLVARRSAAPCSSRGQSEMNRTRVCYGDLQAGLVLARMSRSQRSSIGMATRSGGSAWRSSARSPRPRTHSRQRSSSLHVGPPRFGHPSNSRRGSSELRGGVARKAKSRLARQRAHELAALLAVSLESGDTTRSVELDEEARAVCEEVGRLPAKYRTPVSLCYLGGLTHEEAAASLSWPVGTIRGRLSRARSLLRCRLTRRGLAPAAVATAVSSAQAVAPRRLIEAAIRAASRARRTRPRPKRLF